MEESLELTETGKSLVHNFLPFIRNRQTLPFQSKKFDNLIAISLLMAEKSKNELDQLQNFSQT